MSDASFDKVGPWLAIRFKIPALTDPLKLANIRTAINERLAETTGKPQVLISFKNVDAVSSQVIGLLLEVQHRVKESKGSLVLSNLGENVVQVLKITRLDKHFDIQPSAGKILAPHIPRKLGPTRGPEIDWQD